MAVTIRPFIREYLEDIKSFSGRTWSYYTYHQDFAHQLMSCVFDENNTLFAVGFVRHGSSPECNVMEIIDEVAPQAIHRISEIREALYPSLVDMANKLRDPSHPTKLVAWYNESNKDGKDFYGSMGFKPYQTWIKAERVLEGSLPHVSPPVGLSIQPWPMETRDDRLQYVRLENEYYYGVVYRSLNFLEWMMGGPELHTIAAFDGDQLVGSAMNWQTGAVDRIFVVPSWRGKGLAKCLIAQSFEYHRAHGRNRIETLVNAQDEVSMGLLKSMGYTFEKRLHLLALDI